MKRIRVACTLIPVGMLLWCGSPAAGAEHVPWGDNLLTNGSFEAGISGWSAVEQPTSRPIEALSVVEGCAGKAALQIASPSVGGSIRSPIVRLDPGWYIFSFWYRFELRDDTQPHQLVYINRHTGPDAAKRRDALYFYYNRPVVDGAWYLAFASFQLEKGDTGLHLGFAAGADARSLTIDGIQVRRLISLPDAGEVMTVERRAYGADRIADAQAPEGYAFQVVEGKQQRGGKTGGSARYSSPPGLYRVTYRFRQETPGDGVVLGLRVSGDEGTAMRLVRAEDFQGDGYETFSLYWLYPFGMGCFPAWDWKGTGAYRYASVTLERLQPLSARECWDMLAGDVDVDAVLPSAPPLPAGTRAWVAAGLYTDVTGIREVLSDRVYAESSLVTKRGAGMELSPPMPDLRSVATVALVNVPSRAMMPAEQLALRRFVERGGTLLVFGGFYAFGHGGYQDSLLEEILPVAIKRTFDLTPIDAPLVGGSSQTQAVGGCSWIHDVAVKRDAEVLYRVAGRHPGIAAWNVGKGRVMAVTATMLGDPDAPFWENPAWPRVLNGTLPEMERR